MSVRIAMRIAALRMRKPRDHESHDRGSEQAERNHGSRDYKEPSPDDVHDLLDRDNLQHDAETDDHGFQGAHYHQRYNSNLSRSAIGYVVSGRPPWGLPGASQTTSRVEVREQIT